MTLVQIAEKKKVYIKTYGCQMNVYDSDKLRKILEDGYEDVSRPEEADLILINTCSVRDKPEHKLFSLLGELRGFKLINPEMMIGIGGCVAQQEGQNILDKSKDVDFVFGTHNLSLVPSLINIRKESGVPQLAVNYREDWEDLPLGINDGGRISVFVAISRGCNKNCSYCVVPNTRGKEVSRNMSEIEREVKIAVQRGAKEVVLLGQTVNSYGQDLNPKLKFVDLLDKLSEIPELKRIRFTSPHPQEVRPDFYDLVVNNPKISKHIHMPCQAGSDKILKMMNRNYRRQKYLDIIKGLKDKVPDMEITTDFIVGFPGETEEDFQETLSLMEEVKFFSSYSYMFSTRPGTKAAEMPDHLTHEVKYDRLLRLQELQKKHTDDILASWVGKEGEILIDGISTFDDTKLQGRLSQNILVNLTEETPDLELGMVVPVRITGTSKYTLKGELLK